MQLKVMATWGSPQTQEGGWENSQQRRRKCWKRNSTTRGEPVMRIQNPRRFSKRRCNGVTGDHPRTDLIRPILSIERKLQKPRLDSGGTWDCRQIKDQGLHHSGGELRPAPPGRDEAGPSSVMINHPDGSACTRSYAVSRGSRGHRR